MLRVSLLGNLGADPEVRYTPKGVQIVSFRVAVNQVRTGPDGERQENTEWFRVRVANRLSEYVQRFSKGSKVLVFGRLDIGHYQSKDGEQRTSFDVWADEVQGLSARPSNEPLTPSEADGESAEPALAGVSSLNSAGASAARASASSNGNSNGSGSGKGGRAAGRAAPAPAEGGGDDLEDLPF